MNKKNIQIIKLAAQAHGFYDSPIYSVGDVKPLYYNFFVWREFNSYSFGKLKEEFFDTPGKKIAYLQGVFEDPSEGFGIIKGENYLIFANSTNKVEMCKKWINEIGAAFDCPLFGVTRHEIKYLVPICHRIDIHPKVVEFVKNYQFLPTD